MEDGARTPNTGAKPDIAQGGCLTAFLVAMIIANAGTAQLYLLNWSKDFPENIPESITQQFPRMSQGLLLLLGFGALLNIVLAALVCQWRRVGVYGFFALALLAFSINLYVGIPVIQAIGGLLGPLILALLVRPRWSRFV